VTQSGTAVANQFVISRIVVDVVYGQTPKTCGSINPIQLKTSLTYLAELAAGQNISTAHIVSGTPGYVKGSQILIAEELIKNLPQTDGSTNSIKLYQYNLNGFALKGADQNG